MNDSPSPPPPTDRPAGPPGASRVPVTRTYLRLDALAALRPAAPPRAAAVLHPLDRHDLAGWRALYARVGAPWQWHDRDAWTDRQLAHYLADEAVRVWRVLVIDDDPADGRNAPRDADGLLELCRHDDGSVEVVYLGLVEAACGRGLGAWLVSEAVRRAFADGARSVWLHTCTLDAPAALPNYLARGFAIERTETYEVDRPA
jgi:GNAT superfamily N-acetyltransferase